MALKVPMIKILQCIQALRGHVIEIFLFFILIFVHANIHALDIDADIEFIALPDNNGYSVNADNKEPFPVYIHIDFSLVSYTASVELPAIIKLESGTTDAIVQLHQIEGQQRFSYSVRYSFMFTDPRTTVIDDYLYYFPFKHGTAHRVGQGWNGSFSHRGQNTYAVDFNMDEGTEIYAAREGIVVSLKEDSNIGGASARYADHTNYVLVQHSDGSFSNYVHLQYNGALVNKGDTVQVGDVIGLSGSTGVSTGPHLHFDVRIFNTEGKFYSIPFMFSGKDGVSISPLVGRTYYAYFPNKKAFTEIRGENIKISDYDSYRKSLESSFSKSEVSIRTETYDDRLVVFIANGNDAAIEATVNFSLNNLESLLGNPINISIQAREELFLTILLVKDLAKRYGLQSRIRYKKPQ